MTGDLDRLRDLESRFVLGCRSWYLLLLWQRHGSFESSSVEDRIRIAEDVLATDGRGGVTWAWGGWLALIEHLIERLNVTDPFVREEAAIALGDLEGDGGRAVTVLLERVQSAEITTHDRACAAWALGRIGREQEVVVPILVGLLHEAAKQSDADELRRCLAEAIESLTDDDDLLLKVARLCLMDQFYKCKLIGLSLAERLGDQRPELRPLVEPMCDDEVEEVRAIARRITTDFS
jgi:HEAT repeat protein